MEPLMINTHSSKLGTMFALLFSLLFFIFLLEMNTILNLLPFNSPNSVNVYCHISVSYNLADYKKNTRYWFIFKNVQDLILSGGRTIDGNGQLCWPKHRKKDKTRLYIIGATVLTFESYDNLIITNLTLRNPQRMHLTLMIVRMWKCHISK